MWALFLVNSLSPWIFPSPGGKRWDPDNLSARFRLLVRRAGLSWTFLDLRHTFGSQLAKNDVSLIKIAQLMGNSPGICRKHYAALIPEKMHDVVEFSRPDPTHDDPSDTTDALIRKLLDKLDASAAAKNAASLRIAR